jgi:NADH:ubiquinone oxidoreductase subunit F (NADH-binding)
MNSIEGRRGEARFRPPYPPSQGLWDKPTIINNVETLCNLPGIMVNGVQWFSSMGTEKSKGTKIFSVSGDVQRPGVYELEMGSSLKELVMDLAGAKDLKMVQVGGATGRILPQSMMETKLCFEGVLGSGGVVVFDRSRDVIEMVYRMVEFLAEESCGKCAPCREGTEVMVEILGRLRSGDGVQEDLEVLKDLGEVMRGSSLCGLGQGTPVPVQDSLEHFRREYETRIAQSQLIRSVRG